MKKVKIEKDGRVIVETENLEPSMTQQQFQEHVDVNNIVAKYKTTGEWSHLTKKGGVYADVSTMQSIDYLTAYNMVEDAHDAFMALPAEIRDRFQNDPAKLLSFLNEPKNKDEAIKLGLIEAPKNDPASTKPNEPNEPKKLATNEPSEPSATTT